MNAKQRSIAFLVVALICLLFSAALIIAQPYIGMTLATRTKIVSLTDAANIVLSETAQAAVMQTQAAMTQTQAAIPTNTSTPTNTPLPTPQPASNICSATLTRDKVDVFTLPGGSILKDSVRLDINSPVSVLGRVKDEGWYFVQTLESKRWVRSDYIKLDDPDCSLVEFSLAYLLGYLDNGAKIVVDETFSGNEYFWNVNDDPQFPLLTDYREAYLSLEDRNGTQKILSSPKSIVNANTPFTLIVSFDRLNISSDSYPAIRFRSNGLNYYEVRILPNCEVSVYKTDLLLLTQKAVTDENGCGADGISDSLRLDLNADNTLAVTVNDSTAIDINLGEADVNQTEGKIELVAFRSVISLYYLVVVTQ